MFISPRRQKRQASGKSVSEDSIRKQPQVPTQFRRGPVTAGDYLHSRGASWARGILPWRSWRGLRPRVVARGMLGESIINCVLKRITMTIGGIRCAQSTQRLRGRWSVIREAINV